MRALVQRVKYGSVTIDDKKVGEISAGLVILLGVAVDDTEKDAAYLATKCAHLRIFPDDKGNMNRSVLEVGGEVLIISQFTLYGDTRKGRRPSFIHSAHPETSEPLYETFIEYVRALKIPVATGKFGAMMLVEIHNDGPVTLMLESTSSNQV